MTQAPILSWALPLAEGKGYRLLNEPGEIEATQYPPLLPLVIAAHEWVLGSRDVIVIGHALRITFFLIYIAFTLAVYVLLRTIPAVALRFFRRANYDCKSLQLLNVEPARARDPVRADHNSVLPL